MRETFMRSAKWLVATTAVSIVAMAGCKKDEPAADKPKTESPAKPGGEAKPGEAKPSGEAKPGEAKPGEAKPTAVKPAEVKPAKVIAGGEGLWGLDMPADAVGFASMPSVDELFTLVKTKADKYGMPLPMTKEQVIAKVQSELKAKSMDWLDTTKPIHVAIWNPKKAQGGVLFFPITSKDKFTAALPDTKKENVDGNALSLEAEGETVYLNFVEGYVAASNEKTLFASAKDFGTRLTANHKPTGQLDIRVSAANLRTIFADELKGMEGQMEGLKGMLKGQLEKEMPIPGMGGLDGVIDFYMSLAKTVMDETEALTFSVELDGAGNMALPFSLTAKKDGKIAKFAGSMANADLSFMASAPANSWMLFGGQMDPKAFDGLMDYATDMMAGLLKLSDEEKGKVSSALQTMTKLQDGKSWAAFYADGKFPLAMAGEAGVTDGKAYHKEFDAYMGMLMGKALGMAKEFMPPQLASMPMDDFGKLIEALNNVTKNLGVTLAAGTTTDGDVTVQKLTIAVDMEMLAKVTGPEKAAEAKKFTDLLGTKLEFAMAYGPKKIGMAMGPNGVKVATDIAAGRFAGGADAVVKQFAQGQAMIMHVDVAAALAAFMPIIKEAGGADEVPTFEPGSAAGFAIAAGAETIGFRLYGTLDKFVSVGMKYAGKREEPAMKAAPVEEKKEEAAPAEVKKEEAAAPAEEKKEAAPAEEKKEAAPAEAK